MIQKLKSIWKIILTIDNYAVRELNEILTQMRSLSKEDRGLISKSIKK